MHCRVGNSGNKTPSLSVVGIRGFLTLASGQYVLRPREFSLLSGLRREGGTARFEATFAPSTEIKPPLPGSLSTSCARFRFICSPRSKSLVFDSPFRHIEHLAARVYLRTMVGTKQNTSCAMCLFMTFFCSDRESVGG